MAGFSLAVSTRSINLLREIYELDLSSNWNRVRAIHSKIVETFANIRVYLFAIFPKETNA